MTEIIEKLYKVNFTDEQARTIADILESYGEKYTSKKHMETATGNLRVALESKLEKTKVELQKDLEKTKLELQNELEKTKLELQKEISQSKFDLVKWIVAGVVANGVVATILKYLG